MRSMAKFVQLDYSMKINGQEANACPLCSYHLIQSAISRTILCITKVWENDIQAKHEFIVDFRGMIAKGI